MKIKNADVLKSKKLVTELKELLTKGREKRDKEIFDVEEEILKIQPEFERAKFCGRRSELVRLSSQYQHLMESKGTISQKWSWEAEKLARELELLHGEYIHGFVNEINFELKRIGKEFDFTYSEKIYDGVSDRYIYSFLSNGPSIDKARETLIKAKTEIIRATPNLDLEAIAEIFDKAVESIPDKFLLTDKETGGGERLRDYRDRREAAADRLMFTKEDLVYSTILNPSFYPAGYKINK